MTARPAPYPADTRAKGWRFEVDIEKVKASDTWLVAKSGAVRGALLLLWAEAWQQTPCGTLPNDDELVALLIDMPTATFAKHRRVLLRGWWLAADGRLYHDTITQRVQDMLTKRAGDAKRAADNRARNAAKKGTPPGVTDASRVTTCGLEPEFDTKHQAPSTTEAKASGKRASALSCPEDIDATVWVDWLKLRKDKGATATPTVLKAARAEAEKAGLSLEQFLTVWCLRGTQGLMADWLRPDELRVAKAAPVKSFRQTDADATAARVRRMTGNILGSQSHPDDFIDMEDFDVPAIAND